MKIITVEINPSNRQGWCSVHGTCMYTPSHSYDTQSLMYLLYRDTSLCPFAEDIACWVPELGQAESPTLYADAAVEGTYIIFAG